MNITYLFQTHYRPSIYVAGFNRAPFSYNNILMLSEWMIERPFDFPEYWLVSPCPKGARMLVIATQVGVKYYKLFMSTVAIFSSKLNCNCLLLQKKYN